MDENRIKEEGAENTVADESNNNLWEFVKVVVISLLIVIPIRTYIAQPFIVEGASMKPNFHDGEYLIIDEISYAFKEPKRGDVIVFRYPINPSEYFIKRIIGLPGETLIIKNNTVSVKPADSDQTLILEEPYIPDEFFTKPDDTVELGDDQYFVMGDNRGESSDSRSWGTLPRGNITGKVLVRLWPVTKFGFVKY